MADPDSKNKLNQKVIFEPNVGTEFIIYNGNGSDTSTLRYLNFTYAPNAKIAIIPNQPVYITQVDVDVLEYPLRLDSNQGYIDKKTSFTFSFIKVYTVVANTTIRVIPWGFS